MDLLSPSAGLLFWTIFSLSGLIGLILMFIALISLVRNQIVSDGTKLIWAVIIIFLPVLGSILFLRTKSKKEQPKKVSIG